ncbi:MAG: four helix bundle protein [Paludibacteraceae bacterium]|nr:four helix bundle protein [Paludibacteraceae bacterium]
MLSYFYGEKNIIKDKSLSFAIRIIKLFKYLNSKNEYIISKQVLRSGTSIGANVCEALCGISRKDFLSKMYIAYKEAVETIYWIDILYKSDYISEKEYMSIQKEAREIYKILSSITKTTKTTPNSSLLTPH